MITPEVRSKAANRPIYTVNTGGETSVNTGTKFSLALILTLHCNNIDTSIAQTLGIVQTIKLWARQWNPHFFGILELGFSCILKSWPVGWENPERPKPKLSQKGASQGRRRCGLENAAILPCPGLQEVLKGRVRDPTQWFKVNSSAHAPV